MGNRIEKFDTSIRVVTDERSAYGHPLDDFIQVNMIKVAVSGCPDPAVRHALEMIGVKLARLVTTPDHIDSIIDIAGYARTIAMILDEREKRSRIEVSFPDGSVP